MKIDKYIASKGFTSRRKAIILIEEKRVKVNNKLAKLSTEVKEGDVILINDEELKTPDIIPTIIAYNKPKGVVCTTEKIHNNIIDVIKHPQTIYPIGRLDKDSEGLILLTNQSELINRIAHSKFEHEKEYLVTLNLPVRNQFLKEISEGVEILGEKTKPCKASIEPGTKRVFRIILTQGLNRQIRRMCNAYNYQVIKLQRVRVMNIKLDNLKPGEWRDLTNDELSELNVLLSE